MILELPGYMQLYLGFFLDPCTIKAIVVLKLLDLEKKNGHTHDLGVHRSNLIQINDVVSIVNLKNQTIVHLPFSN